MTTNRRLAVAWIAAALAACEAGGPVGPSVTMPDATAHAARFPIGPGDTHGPAAGTASADCNACHADLGPPVQPSATFKIFACTGCHVQVRQALWHDSVAELTAFHAGVTGFAPDAASCLRCHPTGLATDHSRKFPLPHQNVAGTVVARCADCHVDQADRSVLGCAACHAATSPVVAAHAKVPDFVAADTDASHSASALCLRCHAENTVPVTVAAHAFPIAAGSHSGAAGGRCLACHPALQAAPAKTWAADFGTSTCIGCHVAVSGSTFHDDPAALATLHAGVATYAATVAGKGLSAACLQCHPDGAGGAPANHPQLFPIGTGTAHAGIGCAQCHTNPADRADLAALACKTCHDGQAGFATRHDPVLVGSRTVSILNLYTRHALSGTVPLTAPNCLKCHPASRLDLAAGHSTSESGYGQGDHRPAGCLSCHTALRTDLPYPAIQFRFPTPPSRNSGSCFTSCHSNVN